jgi:hypothetical protein
LSIDENRVFELEKYDKSICWPSVAETDLAWHDPSQLPFRLAGFAWFQHERVFRRLPSRPRYPLPQSVEELANHTAGGQLQFETDSKNLAIRVELFKPFSGDNMSPIGKCGFDCYISEDGKLPQYYSSTRFNPTSANYDSWMFERLRSKRRVVTLNFPNYEGVRSLHVGLDRSASVSAPPPYSRLGTVVIYGTSITQGGSAARPGLVYSNILSRRLNIEVINLGFSGSGLAEPEVAHVIGEIRNPALLVLDYDANIRRTELLKQRTPDFIRILRSYHPTTPMLVCSKPPFMTETINPEVTAYRLARRDFLHHTVDRLRADGDVNIHFFDSSNIYGEQWHECTIDGRHSTDLGFMQMANAFEPAYRALLF